MSLAGSILGGLTTGGVDIGSLVARITGDTTGLDQAMKSSAKILDDGEKSISIKALAIGASIVAIGSAFIVASKKALDFAESLGEMANAVGISTSSLQQYQYVADISGISSDKLSSSFLQFSKRLGELKAGTGELYEKLEKMQSGLGDSIGKSKNMDEALQSVFKAMDQVSDSSERSALAAAAFGREGMMMVNMLKDGKSGMDELMKKAVDLGIVMDEDLIQKADRVNEEFKTMTQILKVELMSTLIELAPEITNLAEGFGKVLNFIKNITIEFKNMVVEMSKPNVFSILFGPLNLLTGGIFTPKDVGEKPNEYENTVRTVVLDPITVTADRIEKDLNTLSNFKYQPAHGLTSFVPKFKPEIDKQKVDEFSNDFANSFAKAMDSMIESVSDSFTESMIEGNFKWIDVLKKQFLTISFKELITEPLFKPLLTDVSDLLKRQTSGGFGGVSYGQVLGAGALGYQFGGVAGGVGAAGGMYLGGPVGGLMGGLVGTMITDMFKDEPPPPKVDILYEVIDGQIEKISESWKNTGYDRNLSDSVSSFFDRQIEFYRGLEIITGQKMADLSFSVSGRGFGDLKSILEGGMNKEALRFALMNYGILNQTFGTKFTQPFEKLYEETFTARRESLVGEKPYYFKKYFGSMEDVIGNESKINELFQFYQDVYAKIFELDVDKLSEYLSGPKGVEWEDFLGGFIEQWESISGEFSQSLGDAFLSTFETGTFQNFAQQFKRSIFDNATQGLTDAFMSNALKIIMGKTGIFQSMNKADKLLKDYVVDKEGISLQSVIGEYKSGFLLINNTMMDLKPLFETMQEGTNSLAEALGLNTEAVDMNSQTLEKSYVSDVENFLNELKFGSLSGGVSLQTLTEQSSKLFQSALNDPSLFSKYSMFMSDTGIPEIGSLMPDYQKYIEGVIKQVEGISWYQEGKDSLTPVNIANEIGKELKPPLKDIKDAITNKNTESTIVVNSVPIESPFIPYQGVPYR